MIDLYVEPRDYTDYVYEAALFDLENSRFLSHFTATQIAQEAALMLEYFESIGEVVTEGVKDTVSKVKAKVSSGADKAGLAPVKVVGTAAYVGAKSGAGAVNAAKSGGQKIKNFFIKIIDFIKGLGARFKDNIQTLFQNGGKWVEQRAKDFENINYSKLSTEVIEYWKGPKLNAIDFVSQDVRKGLNDSSTEHTKIEDYHKAHMEKYHDTNDDLKEGLLNFFRVNTANGSNRVKVEGNGLKYVVVTHAIPYIKNYEKLVTEVQRQTSKVERDLSSIQRGVDDKKVALESFLYGAPFEMTEMAHYPGMLEVVTEARKKNKKRKQQQRQYQQAQAQAQAESTSSNNRTETDRIDDQQRQQQERSDAEVERKKREEEAKAKEAEERKRKEEEEAKKKEEAEEAERKAAEADEAKDSSASSSTQVTVKKNDKSADERKEDAASEKFDKEVEEFDEAKLKKYFYYASTQQLVLTSYMTVIEERYVAYMNILKAVWNAGNTVGGRNKDTQEEKKDKK